MAPPRTNAKNASNANKSGEVAPLRRVLRYKNERVLVKFQERYRLPQAEVRMLFEDMLRFLWLSTKGRVLVLPGHALLDEMWHTFILHTQAYEKFCARFLGRMIHHVPTHAPPASKKRVSRERVSKGPVKRSAVDALMPTIRKQIGFVYDELGSEVAHRWYEAYPARYTWAFIDAHTISRVENAQRKG